MTTYIKKVWKLLVWGLVLGLTLTILLEHVPIRFMLSVMIFVMVVGEFVEWEKTLTGFNELVKKVAWLSGGVIVFVWSRSIVGFFLDQPAVRAYEDIASGGGALALHRNPWTKNMMFELLFLPPGLGFAYLVIKGRQIWKVAMVLGSAGLLVWVAWTMHQPSHAEAMKRLATAKVSFNARGLNNHALANEAAAATSFGVAKEPVPVFYRWDGTNMVPDQTVTNRLQVGKRVKQLHPNDPPVVFESQAFTQVVLPNADGSFIGGVKTWVEARSFDWVDGRNAVTTPGKSSDTTTLGSGVYNFNLGPGETTDKWLVIERDHEFSLSSSTANDPTTQVFWLVYKDGKKIRVDRADVAVPPGPGPFKLKAGESGANVKLLVVKKF